MIRKNDGLVKSLLLVILASAGIQNPSILPDSRLRGNDGVDAGMTLPNMNSGFLRNCQKNIVMTTQGV